MPSGQIEEFVRRYAGTPCSSRTPGRYSILSSDMPSAADPAPVSNRDAMSSAARAAKEKGPWLFVMIVLGSTVINFIDRQTLSVLAPVLRDQFRLSNSDYATIINCFQIAYLVMNGVGGRLSDLLGVRRGMTLFVIWWSCFSTLQAFIVGFKSLGACRFALALGEGGNWATAVKAVAERVPERMRSVAVGVVNSGSSLGTAIATPLVGGLAVMFGWRAAFFLTSLIGFLWLPLWLMATRGHRRQLIRRHPKIPFLVPHSALPAGVGDFPGPYDRRPGFLFLCLLASRVPAPEPRPESGSNLRRSLDSIYRRIHRQRCWWRGFRLAHSPGLDDQQSA